MTPGARLSCYEVQPSRLLLGLMSGTSVDAVTAALVRLRGAVPEVSIELLGHRQHPIPSDVAASVRNPQSLSAADVAVLNFRLGEVFAEAALALMSQVSLTSAHVDAIASHGQTIVHLPDHGATLQIAEPSVIAERTGILTVAEFRYRDMAAGGQGAPLVPLADYALFRSDSLNRAVQNLGGIANVTWLPAGGSLYGVVAFDTGPGSMVIDEFARLVSDGARDMDVNGETAARGRVDESQLGRLLRHPFFARRPPKTTGREGFGREYAHTVHAELTAAGLSPEDCLATVTALTAASIVESYRAYLPALPDEVILGGGGAHNPTLVAMLRERLPGVRLLRHEDFGIPDVAKEAVAFCILANETLLGRPGNVPTATGASRAVPLGKIVFP